jgi:leucyl-tRNA synthetase
MTASALVAKIDHGALTSPQREMRRLAHQMLTKATDDIGRRRTFNTSIAAVMELMNALARFEDASGDGRAVRQEALELVVLVLAPIVPHICHVLWQALGQPGAVIDARWPEPDAAALTQEVLEIVVQVNGKLRGRIQVPASADEAAITQAALADANVQRFVLDKPVRRVIVKGRLVNVVV